MGKLNLSKFKFKGLFSRLFAIEYDVDITDDTAMLYRRNIVVKNIIFFSNMIYTFIFMILSISDKNSNNIVITLILFPVTFVVNHTLKKLINGNEHDPVKQQIASYFCVFYMFLTAILLYVKMRMFTENAEGEQPIYSDAAYVLIYYSLGVISLYQSPKLIRNIAPYLIVVVTILHFVTTHDVIHADYAKSSLSFLKNFFISDEFKDILVRTILLIAFTLVLYALAYITSRMQEQRKQELLKRQAVQDDFTKVVVDMFDITLNGNQITEGEHIQGPLLVKMVEKFSSIYGLKPDEIERNKTISIIHLNGHVDLDVSGIDDKDAQFKKLREQTSLGNEIAKRLELRRKCEDIVRAHSEGWSSDAFIKKTKDIQNNRDSNIILLCDLYITLRSPRNYKRPFSHENSMNLIKNEFSIYFDNDMIDRFQRFSNDFEDLYNSFGE